MPPYLVSDEKKFFSFLTDHRAMYLTRGKRFGIHSQIAITRKRIDGL